MKQKHYSGGLTKEQFLFYEIRVVSSLICEGKERDEIMTEIYENNLFQFPTERMIKAIVRVCFKRIDALESEDLVRALSETSLDVAKQINLYAIMCENAIVYDFMTEVIGEKYRNRENTFSSKDVNVFFMDLCEKLPEANEWSETTVKKIRQVLIRFLVECEYLENIKSDILQPVYLFSELESGIREKNDLEALSAFNCFN